MCQRDVYLLLQNSDEFLSANDISRILNINKSTVNNNLNGLKKYFDVEVKFAVTENGKRKRYYRIQRKN